jgi:hypothetical protein
MPLTCPRRELSPQLTRTSVLLSSWDPLRTLRGSGCTERGPVGRFGCAAVSHPLRLFELLVHPHHTLLYADDIAQLPVFTELARLADVLAGAG